MVDLVKKWSNGSVLALTMGLTLAVAGCSGTPVEETPTPTEAPEPTPTQAPAFAGRVTITSLAYNQAVVLGETKLYDVEFKVDNFTTAAAGNCGGSVNCGRVFAYVGDTKVGEDYQSPVSLDFTKVTGDPSGEQLITLKLVFDDGSDTGESDSETVRVSVPVPPDETPPGIIITSPLPAELLRLGGDANKSVDVDFTTTNITLAAPGSCGGVEGNCGHVHLLIDGEDGNSPDAPYNNAAVSSPATALFSLLEDNGFDAHGNHTITLELHKDDHSPYTNAAGGTIGSSVAVRSIMNDDPFIELTLDPDTEAYELGSDGLKSIPLTYNAENFSLMAPGECGSVNDTCGHVHVLLDGENGNSPEAPYNTASISDSAPFDGLFYWLEYNGYEPVGRKVVTVELHRDDHSLVTLYDDPAVEDDGIAIASSSTIVTEYPTDYTKPVVTIQSPANAANVTLNENNEVNVRFQATNFTSQAAGQCATNTFCGKFCLQIDGDAGNQPGKNCNNEGLEGPLAAKFGVLTTPTGPHRITVKLMKPDGTIWTNNAKDGSPIVILDNANVEVRTSTGGGNPKMAH